MILDRQAQTQTRSSQYSALPYRGGVKIETSGETEEEKRKHDGVHGGDSEQMSTH